VAELEVKVGDQPMSATVSIGIACYPADYTDSIDGLIDGADRAMYVAKKAGRNRTALAGGNKEGGDRRGAGVAAPANRSGGLS
jgi:diguanylate cyclase (GGDEF)-like protein